MSTNHNVANLSITIVKTLVKMAGLGRVADMIDGSQECLNLLADIKNDALDDPNAEMIRSLHSAVKSEIKSIEGALKQDGMSRKLIKEAVAQLSEAARDTIKELAKDDDALIRAVQQPENFGVELKRHAVPRSDGFNNNMQAHYTTLLDRISQEFLTLAPWSPSFDRVALTSLLRCFPALSERIDRLEQHMDRRFDHIELGMREDRDIHIENNQLLKGLSRQNASPIFDHVVFGSRPDVVAGDSFVPRGEQEQLNALITDPTRRRTVLVGMRGCGKTQLAAALAEECEDKNWSLVAWVNAVSSDSIKSSLVELAKKLKIDTSDQPTPETIIRRCFDQLKEVPSDRLIVFDNVENIDDLRGLVPSGSGLRVVATTTNNTGWEHQGWETIKVGVFNRDESIKYLLTVAASTDHDAAETLAHHLGDLPLALAQAAATARNKDLSLTRYLDRLNSYRSERVIRPSPGDYYADDVATALCMAIEDTLENLEDGTKQAALRQLGALALLAESGVPTRWLDPMVKQRDDQELQYDDRVEAEDAHDALTVLTHRSIVQQSADKTTTTLHRLQAQAFRESWDATETENASESAAIVLGEVDVDSFPRNDTDSPRREALDLIEQLRAIGEQAYSHSLFEYDEVCSILLETMFTADDLGMSLELMTLKNALEVLKESIGSNHAVILIARSVLAHSYQRSGHIEKAISMLEELLETSRYNSEQGSAFTLGLSNNLANAYQEVGRNDEAISIYETLIEQTISSPTPDYRTSFTLHNNLARAYLTAGRLDEAISIFEKTLVRCVNTFGEGDLDALSLCDNLAGAYELDGRLDDAICLHQMVLAARTDILGERHADTLTTASNLACAYQSSGRLDEAINLLTTTLANSEQSLGKDNPITCTIRDNLASVYRSARRFPEAITLLMQSIVHCINSFGPRANVTHHLLELLADTFISAGEPSSAIPLFAHLTSEHSKLVGPEDVDALRSRNNLAFSYALSGDFPEAITQWQAILSDCQRCLGPSHSLTVDVSNNLEAAIRKLEQEEDSATE
ncbi:tetratricopeptide repeat protein [Actinomyces sp.]